MNLFHLSLLIGAAVLGLRLAYVLGGWGQRFVRERLTAWRATLRWVLSPVLSWRERAAIGRVQLCLLLLTIGFRLPLIVLGLEHPALQRWSEWPGRQEQRGSARLYGRLVTLVGWPSRQEQRGSAHLTHRLMTLVGNEAVLKRVALASLYPTVEDVPTSVAQHAELVHSVHQERRQG